jgi:hypothetical protein
VGKIREEIGSDIFLNREGFMEVIDSRYQRKKFIISLVEQARRFSIMDKIFDFLYDETNRSKHMPNPEGENNHYEKYPKKIYPCNPANQANDKFSFC